MFKVLFNLKMLISADNDDGVHFVVNCKLFKCAKIVFIDFYAV